MQDTGSKFSDLDFFAHASEPAVNACMNMKELTDLAVGIVPAAHEPAPARVDMKTPISSS